MNYRQREQFKEKLEDIGNQFAYSNQIRAFQRLLDIIAELIDEKASL